MKMKFHKKMAMPRLFPNRLFGLQPSHKRMFFQVHLKQNTGYHLFFLSLHFLYSGFWHYVNIVVYFFNTFIEMYFIYHKLYLFLSVQLSGFWYIQSCAVITRNFRTFSLSPQEILCSFVVIPHFYSAIGNQQCTFCIYRFGFSGYFI